MQIPDRVILRKIREYDPHLFVEWNNRKHWFELWRHMPHGRVRVTPVVQSLYDVSAPVAYTPLDERLLWWMGEADGYKIGSAKKFALEEDRRWKQWKSKEAESRRRHFKDMALDTYALTHNFYATKHASRNSGRPDFNKSRSYEAKNWIAPDVQLKTSPRLFQRSAKNAKAFGYRR